MGTVWSFACIFSFLVANYATAFDKKTNNFPHFIMGRPFHGFVPPPITNQELEKYDIKEGTIEQLIDHFNSFDNRTWTQHYYYNLTHHKEGGPIFLKLGGEAPEMGAFLAGDDAVLMTWARRFNAAVYALEHRFYGKSRPFTTQTVENLKYLSSRQALADAAEFVKTINVLQNYTNPRWIVFGGSYAGALAVWFRELYPMLTIGAVGSSAPVQATLDFHESFEVVQKSLETMGPFYCSKSVGYGFDEIIEKMWTKEGRDELDHLFNLRPKLNETKLRYKDIQYFFSTIISAFHGAAQYHRINAPDYSKAGGVTEVCDIMMNFTMMKPAEMIAAVNEYMTTFYAGQFSYTHNDYDSFIEYLKNPNYTTDAPQAVRSWAWQACTEFGYFPSTDRGRYQFFVNEYAIFKSVLPNNFYLDICMEVFGDTFTTFAIDEAVRRTNREYGGRDRFKGTNVVLPYGRVDPWHALGLYEPNDPSVVPYLSDETAHCADMFSATPSDPAELKVSRQIIENQIRQWTGNEFFTPTASRTSPQATDSSSTNDNSVSSSPEDEPAVMSTFNEDVSIDSLPAQSFVTGGELPLKEFQSTVKTWPLKNLREAMREPLPLPRGVPRMIFGRPIRGFHPEPDDPVEEDVTGIEEGIIVQPLDHFLPSNTSTFNQRFWINSRYAQPGGPLFLFIEGEAPASIKWVTNEGVKAMQSAKKFNGTVFAIEHRYYGESRPTSDLSMQHMRWLSSKQALGDLARFVQAMNIHKNYAKPRWVSFGGSYAGMLSAWFRETYPGLVVGAIASSAPIEVKVDFFEYLMVTANSLAWFDPSCAKNVEDAFEELHQKVLTPEGRQYISDTFVLDPPWNETTEVTDLEVQYFFLNIIGNFPSAVQYNNDNTETHASGGGIKEVCGIMLDNSTSLLDRLQSVNKYIFEYYEKDNFTTTDINYNNLVLLLRNKSFDSPGASARSWLYQACTQFGFFSSTDSGHSIFGSSVPLNIEIDLCLDVFWWIEDYFSSDSILDAIDKTQKLYGGKEYFFGTNVMFINGAIDPWHALSEYGPALSVTSILMNETAHCADMYPPMEGESYELAAVRELIDEQIANWIGVDLPTPLPPSSSGPPATLPSSSLPSSPSSSTRVTHSEVGPSVSPEGSSSSPTRVTHTEVGPSASLESSTTKAGNNGTGSSLSSKFALYSFTFALFVIDYAV